MRFQVTVEVDAATRDDARRLLTNAGHAVIKTSVVKASSSTTAPNPFVRASALLDMPTGLDREAQRAYVRGYARGATAYVRKHGAPSIRATRHYAPPDEDGYTTPSVDAADVEQLGRATREHEWERHPSCHKAALAELARHQDRITAPARAAA